MVPNGVLSGKLPANGGPVRAGMAGGAVAIVGQDPAALDQSLVEGSGVPAARPRPFRAGTRGPQIRRQPATDQAERRPQDNSGDSQSISPSGPA